MEFDTSKYKVWTWRHAMMLHWVINPGIAVNELILGQRVPKVSFMEKDKKKSFAEKSFIPCPHCDAIHSGLKWTPQNNTAFGNWFGLYCDNCGGIIPCLRNLTSLLILVITFPIWYWFKDRWRAKWLTVQKKKFSKPLLMTLPKYKWWYVGLQFAMFTYCCNDIVLPLIMGERLTWLAFLIGIPGSMVAGLIFGFVSIGWFPERIA